MLQKITTYIGVSKTMTILIYKILVLISAGSMFFLLYQMVQTGVLGNLPGDNFTVMLTHHQAVICLGWATFLHIILIKLGVFMKGGAKHDVIFFIHLAFAVMFAFLVMILCYSYTETIAYHSILTILATISYTVVAFIGIPMLFKRF